jgi:hypothetical protein
MRLSIGRVLFVSMVFAMLLIASDCAHQPQVASNDAPGFLIGVWHGYIFLFSFVGGFFTDVRISAYPNSGRWYDFGFILGIFIVFGIACAGSRSARERDGA